MTYQNGVSSVVSKPKRRIADKLIMLTIWFSASITFAVLAWILVYIVSKGITHINWEFVSTVYKPTSNSHGIFPMIISTIYIVLLTVLIATPIGICSAIYLVEYSRPGPVVNTIRVATETLSGIPSIIYGLFGMILFVVYLKFRWSLLSGALTLGIMVLPTVVRATEEALKAVPDMYREGSLALGATKLVTISKIIIPCAIPGILTAVILSVGRIVGETAAVFLTAGYVPNIPSSVMKSGRTLSVHLYMLVKEAISFEQAFATASILIIIVALLNFLASKAAGNIKKLAIGK